MDPSPPAIARAFEEKLPREPQVVFANNQYRAIRSSASSTVEEDAAAVYWEEDIETYHNLLDRYFPRIGHASPLSSRMPIAEQTHRLETESDVLRLATLQLLHPVNVALQQSCPPGTRIFCRTENSPSLSSRFDVEWALFNTRDECLCTLAILEIKNTHVILKDDFKHAAVNERNFQSKTTMAMKQPDLSLLKRNAFWLSKQARKYARNCPYVAVFDWNAMFIFSFIPRSQKPVRGLYFDENGRTGDMTFRRLLFAFVIRPLKKYEATRLRGGA
ncbi:hypothetical protein NUU61_003056 [Penicillium alfredii]|uniref:Uncharacterized protein n=1 Tax=Penicillium alfredii TaxID=1506179 RepID=A0A9W9FSV2_9EURO|nr:uncharacterized protein NUU61_003056 [Penicillium alfredii]KAJ5105709.1 hypothetical protein NUU61_003056 [Penicillium alfredii]